MSHGFISSMKYDGLYHVNEDTTIDEEKYEYAKLNIKSDKPENQLDALNFFEKLMEKRNADVYVKEDINLTVRNEDYCPFVFYIVMLAFHAYSLPEIQCKAFSLLNSLIHMCPEYIETQKNARMCMYLLVQVPPFVNEVVRLIGVMYNDSDDVRDAFNEGLEEYGSLLTILPKMPHEIPLSEIVSAVVWYYESDNFKPFAELLLIPLRELYYDDPRVISFALQTLSRAISRFGGYEWFASVVSFKEIHQRALNFVSSEFVQLRGEAWGLIESFNQIDENDLNAAIRCIKTDGNTCKRAIDFLKHTKRFWKENYSSLVLESIIPCISNQKSSISIALLDLVWICLEDKTSIPDDAIKCFLDQLSSNPGYILPRLQVLTNISIASNRSVLSIFEPYIDTLSKIADDNSEVISRNAESLLSLFT